jgi:uroporphyrinogen-III synthase
MDPFQLAGKPKIACIGPITEQAALDEGFEVNAVAEEYTTDGLIDALCNASVLEE